MTQEEDKGLYVRLVTEYNHFSEPDCLSAVQKFSVVLRNLEVLSTVHNRQPLEFKASWIQSTSSQPTFKIHYNSILTSVPTYQVVFLPGFLIKMCHAFLRFQELSELILFNEMYLDF